MTELLTLRRSTPTYELVKSVPKPKKSVPKRGLPDWIVMGLEQKLPLVNAPKNTVVFSRDKVGKKLWKKYDSQDFVLYDPYCLDVSYTYDPLHDQHLQNYFFAKRNLKFMKELGLVTENGDAVCSLKAFNEYRRYLRRIHVDLINKERIRRESLDKERREIEKAKEYAERDAEAAAKEEQRKLKMAGVIARIRREEQLKREDVERRIQRRLMQLELLEIKRKVENEERKAKGRARDRRIRERISAAARLQRQRTIVTLRQWREADAELRRRRLRKRRERKRSKEEKDQRRWKERIEHQISRMKHTRELLENEAKDLAFRVALRNTKVQEERNRMADLFQRIKEQTERKKSVEHKRRQSQYLAKVLCENWIAQIPSFNKVLNQKAVEETMIKSLIAFNSEKPTNDSVIDILEEAKIRLTKKVYLPPDVTTILDEILDNAIHCFLKKKVEQFVKDIISRGIQTIKNVATERSLLDSVSSKTKNRTNGSVCTGNEYRKRSSMDRRKSTPSGGYARQNKNSRCSVPQFIFSQDSDNKPKISVSSHGRSVCFGKVSDIGFTDQEILTKQLKSVKDRPPTPVPSLTDLAMAVFDTPILLNDIEESKMLTKSGSNMSMNGRDELINQLKYLTQEISRRVYKCLQKELENRSERKRRSLVVTQEEIINCVVEGIEKQGTDYSSNITELESLAHGILGIILHTNWMELNQIC